VARFAVLSVNHPWVVVIVAIDAAPRVLVRGAIDPGVSDSEYKN